MSGALRNDDPWKVRPPDEPGPFHKTESSRSESNEAPRNDGVDDAYRVADENIRDGQWRSGSRNQRGSDWRSQEYGFRPSGYGSPFGPGNNSAFGYGYGGRSPDGLLEQIMRTYMDMMGLVGTMVNGLGRQPYPPPNAYSPRPYEGRRDRDFRHEASDSVQRGRSAAVHVEITSNQANQVALDLKALQPRVSLSIAPLRSSTNGKPELHDIRFDTENDRYVLRIRIPHGQPSGLYSGVIVEARTGEPCGTLVVQVGSAEKERVRTRSSRKS